MKIAELNIPGVFLIDNFNSYDDRGVFVKTFSIDFYKTSNISFVPKEIYYSVSNKDVVRGMHFQLPPMEHAKLIFLTSGEVVDVVLDLRRKSPTYGKFLSVNLSAHRNSIYIPAGCAHGFKALMDNSIMIYNQTTCYSKEHDMGILWNTFGFDWEIDNPILSDRDKSFASFSNFSTPF